MDRVEVMGWRGIDGEGVMGWRGVDEEEMMGGDTYIDGGDTGEEHQ